MTEKFGMNLSEEHENKNENEKKSILEIIKKLPENIKNNINGIIGGVLTLSTMASGAAIGINFSQFQEQVNEEMHKKLEVVANNPVYPKNVVKIGLSTYKVTLPDNIKTLKCDSYNSGVRNADGTFTLNDYWATWEAFTMGADGKEVSQGYLRMVKDPKIDTEEEVIALRNEMGPNEKK